jgi:hypothetical protein
MSNLGNILMERVVPAPRNSASIKSVVVILNKDSTCFFRAFAVAAIYQSSATRRAKNKLGKDRKLQRIAASNYASRSGRTLGQAVTIFDFDAIQESMLPDYRLVVFDGISKRKCIYKGNPNGHTNICLEYFEPNTTNPIGHFNAIVNVHGFVGPRGRWCFTCNQRYHQILKLCPNLCYRK